MPYPTLPATLSTGIVSIYGAGDSVSVVSGLVTTPGFYFGPINQVSIYSAYNIGDSVMFPESAISSRVLYLNDPYTLVKESEIVLIELAL
jgi:hypothetical protein